MDSTSRLALSLIGLLTVATLAYPLLPMSDDLLALWYSTIAVVALIVAYAGLRHHRPARRSAWLLVLSGFAGWVVGDLVYEVEQRLLHLDVYPAPSDAFYLGSYGLLAAGALVMVRSRRGGRDLTALLDALIIAVGAGVVVGVFVVAPLAVDSTLSVFGRVVASAYPIADLVLLGILVRLWSTPGARTAAFRLLTAALGCTLLGDAVYNFSILATGDSATWRWNDVPFLACYLFVAAAVWVPSMRVLAEPAPDREEVAPTRRRLVLLACGLMLPAGALLLDGAVDGEVLWPVLGIGSLVLSVLVLVRMAGLLNVVQVQAIRLAALARSDALTGAPNRRTWDHELSRACQVSRDRRSTLSVALLDLDHFKAYNDTFGHQAGDLLLREAVAAWTQHLEGVGMLARYGGEEFAVLLPGHAAEEARRRVDALRALTPRGQTFSAGVAEWDRASEPGAAVARADEALYDAKRAGRDRVVIAREHRTVDLPTPRIALQSIVRLDDGRPVAVEALSRFADRSPAEVFEQARREGRGGALETLALRTALEHRTPGRPLSVNVSLPVLCSAEVAEVLPQDLSGIVLEITEYTDVDDVATAARVLGDLRGRGAQIAVDDWGRGFSNVDRVLALQPDVVKVDMSLIHGLDSPYYRAAIRAITAWADEVGATVCAEGIETDAQWRALQELGVHTGQGFLFDRPTLATAPAAGQVA